MLLKLLINITNHKIVSKKKKKKKKIIYCMRLIMDKTSKYLGGTLSYVMKY